MKAIKRLASGTSAAVLTLSTLLSLSIGGVAHAASSVTWTGGGSDGNWSTTGNWAGGAAPVNGDSVVIDNSATFTNGSKDDIANLSLASLTFTNNGSGGPEGVLLEQNLTVTTAITQASSVTTTANFVGSDSAAKTITLGGDVTVTATTGITLGTSSNADQIALGGHTLTFTDTGLSTANITVIDAAISGTGAVVYNGPSTDYQIWGTNTYSGTTHVIASNLGVLQESGTSLFGTSSVTVETGSSVEFSYSSSATISNPITINGTTSGSPVVSLGFNSQGSNTTLTVPNITLTGNTRFSNENVAGGLKVDLAGLTPNGHCIQYLGGGNSNDAAASNFLNGPASCVVTSSAASPKTPDTGFAYVSSHPAVVLGAAVAAAGAIFVLARSTRKLSPAQGKSSRR